jgi:hypothetical protein
MNSPTPSPLVAHSVLAGGERIPQSLLREDWDSPQVQRLLFAARQRFGHALCTCRPQPLKLQVRLRDDKCHLAVWPQEHPAHDSECIFFHDDVAASASAMAALRNAVHSGPEPVASLPAAAPPTAPQPPRIALWTGPQPADDTQASPVTIKSLAQRLWEVASLCRWYPGWTRDWGRTRYQLQRGACEFTLNGHPLEDLLFVPRPYREAAAGAVNAEWERFLRSLHVEAALAPRLLIAPVRAVNPPGDQSPATVLLRHLRGPIGLTTACYDFISRDGRNALSNSRVGSARRAAAPGGDVSPPKRYPELMGFFFVEGSSRGGVWARAGWLMAVHPSTYIPSASSNVVMLIDALVAGRYAFQHLISEAPPSRRTAPDLLVRHVRGPDGIPVPRAALEVLSPAAPSDFVAARAEIARRMGEQGIPTWLWTPAGKPADRHVPPLPPLDQVPADVAADVLQQIAADSCADYQYGFSTKFTPTERTFS